ncbi:hypothetical protein KFE80_00830 [bacterium SCSIO 12696]|nr:hypothetical protein KFE80_00830 [bacterium SCSIO 12696]
MHREFCLHRSRLQLAYTCTAHLLPLLATWLAPLSVVWILSIWVLVVASFVRSIFCYWRALPVLIYFDESWQLRSHDGKQQAFQLQAPCYIGRWLSVIGMRFANGKLRHLVVPFDSLSAESYRRLRVQLSLALN